MRIKKLFLLIIIVLVFSLTTGCYYKKLDDNEKIVIAPNPAQTVIFVEGNSGYTPVLRFIVKTEVNGKRYIKEGKYYNGAFTYSTIMNDRDFELLNCYNQTLFLSNEDGLQEVNYKEKKKWLDDAVISDIPSSYRQNGFNEVIKIVNENKFVLPEDLNIQHGYLGTQVINENDSISTIKSRYYIYMKDDNVHYSEQVNKKIINETGATIDEFWLIPETDTVLYEKTNIKKALISPSKTGSFVYILDQSDCLLAYDSNMGMKFEYHGIPNIQAFLLFEEKPVLVSENYIYIFDTQLNIIEVVDAGSQVLGMTWYKDPSTSCLKYAITANNDIKILNITLPNKQ